MNIQALVRVAKQQVRLATRGLDGDGLIEAYLEEIPIQLSSRQASTRMGFYNDQGANDIGRIVINVNQCYNEARFMSVLLHELAHAVNHWLHGDKDDCDGPNWGAIMVQLGQKPDRCFKEPT